MRACGSGRHSPALVAAKTLEVSVEDRARSWKVSASKNAVEAKAYAVVASYAKRRRICKLVGFGGWRKVRATPSRHIWTVDLFRTRAQSGNAAWAAMPSVLARPFGAQTRAAAGPSSC